MESINKDKFLFLYQNEYGQLNSSQINGLTSLLEYLTADENVTDMRHAAYMLATTKHECAGKWQPIAEYGKGTGKKYGLPDKVTGQTYYGRGYVQLTWKENYQAMSQVCGLDFVNNPDLVMDSENAYKIMSYGMRKGSFTGVRLGMFINNEHCDYVNARKIINGLDCSEKIAKYAETIEGFLKESAS